MQGRNDNILTCSDKLQGFIKKLELWQKELQKGYLEMYQRTNHITIENKQLIVDLAQQHLSMLQQKFDQYFYSINTEQYDWIRNPFATNAINSTEALPLQIREEFTDLNNDMTLKLCFSEVPLDVFWIYFKKEYLHISYKAILTLLPFSTTYLCEQSFSTLVLIKNDRRSCLKDLDQELREDILGKSNEDNLIISLVESQKFTFLQKSFSLPDSDRPAVLAGASSSTDEDTLADEQGSRRDSNAECREEEAVEGV
ncbi:SCAN domain-containing protein 3 [Trichonephila clavata]|uniref:SCAN domain-containing protein 3 n=1 Tax=Trichonephila clavata TaxID=2740835 RepID=A0A8X6HH69_TRICU|nr:SCAN domain-containing protein 3 [Trichonephila clavata]